MPPGDYFLAMQVSGFGQQTQSGVHVDANQNAQTSFTLTVGSQSQEVTATSAAPLIDTRELQLGTTIDIKRIEDLPLNGRDVSSLVQLVPGVTAYSAAGPGGNQYGTTFSVTAHARMRIRSTSTARLIPRSSSPAATCCRTRTRCRSFAC